MTTLASLYELFRRSSGISTDSRKMVEGKLFVALKGPHFDGNHYAREVLANGAIAALVDDSSLGGVEGCILVSNALESLQKLASWHREKLEIPVLCITGSNGKTTTKELIHAVLSQNFRVHASRGNFNNLIGLPLAMLEMPEDTQIAVFEIGSNAPGEIASLSAIAMPTHGLVTNVGDSHLEGFDDLDGVIKEKKSLYDHLARSGGLAFINLDEDHLANMAATVTNKVYYGSTAADGSEKWETRLRLWQEIPAIRFSFRQADSVFEGHSQLAGRHNFRNICAAVAVGLYFGMEGTPILKGVESYLPANNRTQIIRLGSNTVVLDAYNANPSSVGSALSLLEGWPEKKKVVILGDMLELGKHSKEKHEMVLQKLEAYDPDRIILVGEQFGILGEGRYECYRNVDELISGFTIDLLEDSLVLIKGSRGIQLEKLLNQV